MRKKTWHKQTLGLVRKFKGSIPDLCKAAKISVRWFYDFRSGKTPDPGINKVERLYNELKRK